jgi:hypothetical protein
MALSRNTVKRYLERAAPVRVESGARGRPVFEKVRGRLQELLEASPQWTGGKQRLTATRLHSVLVSEGLTVGITTVKEAVVEWKRRRREVFVPLIYLAGDLAEVDFFEVLIDLRGEREKAWVFVMRLMHSGRDFAWLYLRKPLRNGMVAGGGSAMHGADTSTERQPTMINEYIRYRIDSARAADFSRRTRQPHSSCAHRSTAAATSPTLYRSAQALHPSHPMDAAGQRAQRMAQLVTHVLRPVNGRYMRRSDDSLAAASQLDRVRGRVPLGRCWCDVQDQQRSGIEDNHVLDAL